MVGTLPKTALLLTHYKRVEGHFSSYGNVARHLGISVSNTGKITFMGERVYPNYIMKDEGITANNHWKSKAEVINDWATNYMSKNLDSNYSIYRYLTN